MAMGDKHQHGDLEKRLAASSRAMLINMVLWPSLLGLALLISEDLSRGEHDPPSVIRSLID